MRPYVLITLVIFLAAVGVLNYLYGGLLMLAFFLVMCGAGYALGRYL